LHLSRAECCRGIERFYQKQRRIDRRLSKLAYVYDCIESFTILIWHLASKYQLSTEKKTNSNEIQNICDDDSIHSTLRMVMHGRHVEAKQQHQWKKKQQ
jgi:hypothetical protein